MDDDAVDRAREIIVRGWDNNNDIGSSSSSSSSASSYEAWASALEVVCAASAVQPA